MTPPEAARRERPRSAEDIRRYRRHTSLIEAAVVLGVLVCMGAVLLTHLVMAG